VAALVKGGAVVLGKTATQEFAAGVVSAPARNPWNSQHIPGGSSGGSAAAVASGACFGALGSDTGGSIRIPAAACGVCGFKPVFGALDTGGVYPLSWSLDTVGPIARTVDDVAIVWDVLRESPAPSLSTGAPVVIDPTRLRLGVSRTFFFEALQPAVRSTVDAALDRLAAAGVTIVESPWPDAASARACGFLINRIETAAVHEHVATSDLEAFARYGPDLRLRIAAGRSIPATLYARALRWRPVLRDSMAAWFAQHEIDALLAPALPTTALLADQLRIEGTGRDESVGAAWTRLTMPFNATGQPVLSVPAGIAADGLPVGIQLAGKPGAESELFAAGHTVADILAVHELRPSVERLRREAREVRAAT
jgi:aspartyl-tRNA(Asn)/glutamyl-tRNA(Gln) amidotransferase subunit A